MPSVPIEEQGRSGDGPHLSVQPAGPVVSAKVLYPHMRAAGGGSSFTWRASRATTDPAWRSSGATKVEVIALPGDRPWHSRDGDQGKHGFGRARWTSPMPAQLREGERRGSGSRASGPSTGCIPRPDRKHRGCRHVFVFLERVEIQRQHGDGHPLRDGGYAVQGRQPTARRKRFARLQPPGHLKPPGHLQLSGYAVQGRQRERNGEISSARE